VEATPPPSWQELKERGNALFRSKEHAAAAAAYSQALALVDADGSTLSAALSNWAASLLAQQPDESRSALALLCSLAAVAVAPSYAKARHRAASSLERLAAAGVTSGMDGGALLRRLRSDEAAVCEDADIALAAARAAALLSSPALIDSSTSGDAVLDAAASAACRKRGNELFTAGRHAEAAEEYCAAVAHLRPAGLLLCNRAACAAHHCKM